MNARRIASVKQGVTAAMLALAVALFFPRAMDDGSVGPALVTFESKSDYLQSVRVRAYEFGFEPSNLVVKVGYPVSWRAVGEQQHLITPSSEGARWIFYRAARRGAARHVFDDPGIYRYYCSLHPQMRGTITVRRDVSG